MPEVKVEYDKQDIRQILRSYKAMSDEAVAESKRVSYELAQYLSGKIRSYAISTASKGDDRIAANVRISRSSKIGEFAYGFKSQRVFSGGANSLDLVYGLEFGANRYPQFPKRSPKLGRGNVGYFIYPTLRQHQPEVIKRWEESFDKILKEFN